MIAINPGSRDHQLTIEKPTSTADSMGGRSKTWTKVCDAWGKFKRPRINTALVQGGAAAVVTQEIILPMCEAYPGYRVICSGHVYKVIGVSSNDRRYVTLLCEEVEHHAG